MFQLAAVFSPGFEKVIPNVLNKDIPDAYKVTVSSGFVRFCTDKKPFRAVNADYFNNSFLVLKEWNAGRTPQGGLAPQDGGSKAPAFEVMANKIRIPDTMIPEIMKQHYKTFRLRFSAANVFTSVNKNLMANVEHQISAQTGLKPDRLGGDTEFWFLTRSDGYACFALRMTKKQSTEKYLEKGELRPEFVTLLAAFAEMSAPLPAATEGTVPVILDPFAGHGGIVKRLSAMYPKARILSSEIEGELAAKIKGCRQCDATKLSFIQDSSIDWVITDPPWGFWQGDLRDDGKLKALYDGMLKELFRITKPGSALCILTAAKEVFEESFNGSSFAAVSENHNAPLKGTDIRTDVLVNGKKAAVYSWKR